MAKYNYVMEFIDGRWTMVFYGGKAACKQYVKVYDPLCQIWDFVTYKDFKLETKESD